MVSHYAADNETEDGEETKSVDDIHVIFLEFNF
jgi:hypothetical protein